MLFLRRAQDNARLSVTVKLPQGTRVETTKALGDQIVKEIREKYPNEIKTINYSVGMPDEDNTFSLMRENVTIMTDASADSEATVTMNMME